ncbi:hypothetical protein BX616_010411 [Lobosporangium transversale]|uniref:Uncharacterized protein n=1 Tax=Lobosporangium transversale TaxID=64571 RepID=A0A1Y2H2B0_9FUNG|nr:hypothetical protein BCR41DRAFT_343896 [Lobosporangium transversale]KAF9912126.1 hypothetical protein BX616_010411 [Lobosporangium transversale]ORZ28686.1 hypothetical protein BCR41DRAFT_343896 [Lobosporangium transversale]|eukprot:XP_021886359.1 hypothetical protein BCR41DRAFT_343896 [Lobosporangium transversale]
MLRQSRPHTPPTSTNINVGPRNPSPGQQATPHPFLQSPTHARSNSGTMIYPPFSPSSQPRSSHTISKDASSFRKDPSALLTSAETATAAQPLSSEPERSSMLSFAAGYSLHLQAIVSPTIAKPIAVYPQEHPQRKRFSPRFSGSSVSYTTYSSALALTFHQQQQLLQQHQQQQQQQRKCHHPLVDRLDKHSDNSLPSCDPHQHYVYNLDNRAQHRHTYTSPPSPCTALDASSCHCSRPSRCSHSHSYPHPPSQSSIPSGNSASHVSISSSLSVASASTETNSVASATTGMDQCSPILSHAITAALSDVILLGKPAAATALVADHHAVSLNSQMLDFNSPVENGLVSVPSSPHSSTRTPSPMRSRRTSSSLASPSSSATSALSVEDNERDYECCYNDSVLSYSSSASLPLKPYLKGPDTLLMQTQQTQHQQARQQRPSKQARCHNHHLQRRHAQQALAAQSQGQQYVSSKMVPSGTYKRSCPSPNSPQAIAQNSTRYIRFLWLPLLPLLILALGPTSTKFETPTRYAV